jgi:COP9 signalosome complex subunit 1
MQTKGLEAARNYEKEAIERIRRMSLAAADLEVRGSGRKGAGTGGASLPGIGDAWIEETRRQLNQPSGDDASMS